MYFKFKLHILLNSLFICGAGQGDNDINISNIVEKDCSKHELDRKFEYYLRSYHKYLKDIAASLKIDIYGVYFALAVFTTSNNNLLIFFFFFIVIFKCIYLTEKMLEINIDNIFYKEDNSENLNYNKPFDIYSPEMKKLYLKIIIILIFHIISSILFSYIQDTISKNMETTMKNYIWIDNLLKKHPNFFKEHSVNSILNSSYEIFQLVIETPYTIVNIICDLIDSVGGLIYILWYGNIIVTGVIFLILGVAYIISRIIKSFSRHKLNLSAQIGRENDENLFDKLSNLQLVFDNNSFAYEAKKIKANENKYIKLQMQGNILSFISNYVLDFSFILLNYLVFIIVILMFSLGNIPLIREILRLYKIRGMKTLRLFLLINNFKDIKFSVRTIMKKLAVIIISGENVDYGTGKSVKFTGDIMIKDLTIKYYNPHQQKLIYILDKVDCNINAGDKVIIIGKSGTGKSTFINALCQSIKKEGQVLFNGENGIDIDEISRESISQQLLHINQDNLLLRQSIKNNIVYPSSTINEEALKSALEYTELSSAIENLPEGIDSDPSILSGGQRKRIMIARAFYKYLAQNNVKIVLMDEYDSGLDSDTKQKIDININNVFKDSTIIVITHNVVDSMQWTNKVFFIEDSKIKHFVKEKTETQESFQKRVLRDINRKP